MGDSWLEGELMGEEEKKIIKKDLLLKRMTLVGVLVILMLYYGLGILRSVWSHKKGELVFNCILMFIVVFAALAITLAYFKRIKFINDGRYVWKQGFITGYEPNEKFKLLHGRLLVDDTRSDYYGFRYSYKVGDQVLVLDFTEGFKFKDTIAVNIKY